MPAPPVKLLRPRLAVFSDTCNVYLVRGDTETLAIDFGSGRWLSRLRQLGWPPLRHVLLTHHHADQCAGLLTARRSFIVHAPVGEREHLSPAGVRHYWKTRNDGPVPSSYSVLTRGLPGIRYDLAGFSDFFWDTDNARRVRCLATPGHSQGALSMVIDLDDEQIVFCGDVAHAGATVWQPFHLEWDHWTGSGALAAWEGIERLRAVGMDLLCPSHGPVIDRQPRRVLTQLSRKLLALHRAKGSICPGEKDRYLQAPRLFTGARRVLPSLYHFGVNGYLLLGDDGQALVIDAQGPEMVLLRRLLRRLGRPRITATTATHYHGDHADGLDVLRRHHGTRVFLHPLVAAPLRDPDRYDIPWRMGRRIIPDALLPHRGRWRWNRYVFEVAHFPGQTWWHCCLMTAIDGKKVFFGGDNFQPNSRWNGTGGFCAYNGCRFADGFERSARLVLRWRPDIVASGHGTYVRFAPSQYRKIIRWSRSAAAAVRALCPAGDTRSQYDLHQR